MAAAGTSGAATAVVCSKWPHSSIVLKTDRTAGSQTVVRNLWPLHLVDAKHFPAVWHQCNLPADYAACDPGLLIYASATASPALQLQTPHRLRCQKYLATIAWRFASSQRGCGSNLGEGRRIFRYMEHDIHRLLCTTSRGRGYGRSTKDSHLRHSMGWLCSSRAQTDCLSKRRSQRGYGGRSQAGTAMLANK